MTDGFALKSWVINLVNKVSKKNTSNSDKYELDKEVKIGTWVDGKPLYRKIYNCTEYRNPMQVGSGATNFHISGADIDTIRDIRIYGIFSNHRWVEPCSGYIDTDSYVYISVPFSYTHNGGAFYIAIEYTKTTDKATITV